MPPALKAMLAQIGGGAAAYALARTGLLPAGVWPLAASQAIGAAACAGLLRSARWWLPIHLAFVPALIFARQLDIAPGWYLAAFVALAATFWTSFRTQVPLYLSNRATIAAIAELLPQRPGLRILDVGSGTGSFVAGIARHHPPWQVCGIEAAPAPWLASRWRTRSLRNAKVWRGDFFRLSWSEFDVIYAFLSPVPMADVWNKACRELAAGALLVSNSFPVPGRKPDQIVELDDSRSTRLFLYRVQPGETGTN